VSLKITWPYVDHGYPVNVLAYNLPYYGQCSNICNFITDSQSVNLRIITVAYNRHLCPNPRHTCHRYTPRARTSGRGDSNTLLASRRHQHKSAPYNSTKYGTSGDLVSDMATGKKTTQNETLVLAHLVNMRSTSILAGLF